MPRERFKTLTEQMFYLLLCLREECRGMEIEATGALRGRRRYRITEKGSAMLAKEYERLREQIRDYERYAGKEAQP